jgi:hypothetical protein
LWLWGSTPVASAVSAVDQVFLQDVRFGRPEPNILEEEVIVA